MSNYHPLDVRHPDNRGRERKDYLLDGPIPPAPTPQSTPERRPIGSRQPVTPAATAAPWGGQRRAEPAAPAPTTRRSGGGYLRGAFMLVAMVLIIGAQTDLLDDVIRQVQFWAYSMGLWRP